MHQGYHSVKFQRFSCVVHFHWFPLSASMLPQQVAIVVLFLCECYRKRAQINVPVDKQVVLFPDDA